MTAKQLICNPIKVHTDGSCHTQLKIGAWVAILSVGNEKVILSGHTVNTTHNRMELTAVIEAIKYIKAMNEVYREIHIISDSQYVVGLPGRREKLLSVNYTAKNGSSMKNADLVKSLFDAENMTLHFKKIKAHQVNSGSADYNIEADKLCRKMVRELVAQILFSHFYLHLFIFYLFVLDHLQCMANFDFSHCNKREKIFHFY